MRSLKVWAPHVTTVELSLQSSKKAMTKSNDGWWHVDLGNDVDTSFDYGFIVDGKGPFPDPRSRWQPSGVHGLSRFVDITEFDWGDDTWHPPPLKDAIIYELHIGTFTQEGTFLAAIDKLDYLVNLGVTHIELMPVGQFSGRHGWGYDVVQPFAPHNAYGSPTELKKLIDVCHAKGLAVFLDVVYNHHGPSGNYLMMYGPYFCGRYKTQWGDAVNFDGPYSDEVRRYFIDNALMWLKDFHFDGLRLDAVHAIFDTSALHFLEQLANEVETLQKGSGKEYVLIAESDLNDPRIIRSTKEGGYNLDAQWNEDFHHALHSLLTGERNGYYLDFGSLQDLADVLQRGFTYDGRYSLFRKKSFGRSVSDINGNQFIGCIQNHDQVGNRACGERIGHLIDIDRLKVAAAILFCAPFIPMLFQGEEWGASSPFLYFTDHGEPDLAAAVTSGRRREFAAFGWDPAKIADPQDEKSFTSSKLQWSEKDQKPHAEIYQWYQSLIKLRKTSSSLCNGNLEKCLVAYDEEEQWLRLQRGTVILACNFSEEPIALHCQEQLKQAYNVFLASKPDTTIEGAKLLLPPLSAVILS